MKDNKRHGFTHADHIHQHDNSDDPREIRHNARTGAFDTRPMQLSPVSDDHLKRERDRACGLIDPIGTHLHDDPRPGHHYHTMTMTRDDERKHRAALLSRQFNEQNSERDALRSRCHAIINSWEHMESDKEIALLALEQLVTKGQ